MTIYRTRYRDPKERRWFSRWADTRRSSGASQEMKLEIAIGRFELNPGKSNIVRFLNAHADE